jgi:hypothetical protein
MIITIASGETSHGMERLRTSPLTITLDAWRKERAERVADDELRQNCEESRNPNDLTP